MHWVNFLSIWDLSWFQMVRLLLLVMNKYLEWRVKYLTPKFEILQYHLLLLPLPGLEKMSPFWHSGMSFNLTFKFLKHKSRPWWQKSLLRTGISFKREVEKLNLLPETMQTLIKFSSNTLTPKILSKFQKVMIVFGYHGIFSYHCQLDAFLCVWNSFPWYVV